MTRWCFFSVLSRPRWPQPAPTSRYDLLVLFFTSTLTTQAATSTSESLWLAGAIFPFFDDHAGHRTLISTWCGTTTSLHPMTMIISHPFFFLLVFYFVSFLYCNFTSTSSMNYNVNLSYPILISLFSNTLHSNHCNVLRNWILLVLHNQISQCLTALDSASECATVLYSAFERGTVPDSASKHDLDTIGNINYYKLFNLL